MKIYVLLGHPGLDKEDVKTIVRDSKYCIVGEAFYTGRETGYYIVPLIPFAGSWMCVKFGRVVGKIAKRYGQLSAGSHLQPMISHLVEYWNSILLSLMI